MTITGKIRYNVGPLVRSPQDPYGTFINYVVSVGA